MWKTGLGARNWLVLPLQNKIFLFSCDHLNLCYRSRTKNKISCDRMNPCWCYGSEDRPLSSPCLHHRALIKPRPNHPFPPWKSQISPWGEISPRLRIAALDRLYTQLRARTETGNWAVLVLQNNVLSLEVSLQTDCAIQCLPHYFLTHS